MKIYHSFSCGNFQLLYLRQKDRMGISLIPSSLQEKLSLEGKKVESMIQFKVAGTPFRENWQGSMRNSPCVEDLLFLSQEQQENKVITRFQYGKDLYFDHTAQLFDGWLRIGLAVRNEGENKVELDFLPSFSLGIVSLQDTPGGEGQYFLERVTERWHHEEISMERAGLEGNGSLRFGTNGTAAVCHYYPFAGIEDRKNGILWGAQLENTSSFCMEFAAGEGGLSLSGGMPEPASRGETFSIPAGGTFQTMEAILTCVQGNILDLFNALQASLLTAAPESSPIYSGAFSMESLSFLKQHGIKYFLVDTLEPGNIAKIREMGLIPGISWNVETSIASAGKDPRDFLTRNGRKIQLGEQNFIDLRKTELRNAILEELCFLLEKHHIGYIRFLCPFPFCGGCDGVSTSPLENQQEYMEKVFAFYEEFKSRMPEVIMELATPGIGRLSPKWLALADVITPVDELPAMASAMAALDRQMLAPGCKYGVHTVLQRGDDLYGKLNASLLGRVVLSGDLTALSPEEKGILGEFLHFYRSSLPVLERGSYLLGHIIGESCMEPAGWQVLYKMTSQKELIVFHIFSGMKESLFFDLLPCMKERGRFAREIFWQTGKEKMELSPCEIPASGAVLLEKQL